MDILLLVLLILLAGAGAIVASARRWPGWAHWIAWGAVAASLLVWLLARAQLPLLMATPGVETDAVWGGVAWRWQVDQPAWQMSLWLLLFLFLVVSVWPDADERAPSTLGLTLAMGVAGLLPLWAENAGTLLASWTLLGLIWAVGLWLGSERAERVGTRLWWRLSGLGAALFCLGMGAATGAAGWLLLAAAVQLGAFPLHGWRPTGAALHTPWSGLLLLLPAYGGAALLARIGVDTAAVLAYSLPLTGVGLLSLLAGVLAAWRALDDPSRLAAALVMSQAGVILLASSWGGGAVVLAEARVLLLAFGLLLVVHRATPTPVARLVAAVAVAALGAGPLLAGFAGRTALYDAWIRDGRPVLLFVTALLHVLLVAGALAGVWRGAPAAGLSFTLPATNRPAFIVRQVGLLLPAVALVTFAGLAQAGWLSWVLVLLPLAAGIFLSRYTGSTLETAQIVRQSLRVRFPWHSLNAGARAVLTGIGAALREAAGILESEGGILWLLLFLVIFWLAR